MKQSDINRAVNALDLSAEHRNILRKAINAAGSVDADLFVIVDKLPTSDIKSKIYCVKDKTSTEKDNRYIEYIYIEDTSSWEKIGEFKAIPDMNEYLKKTQSANDVNKGAILNGGTLVNFIAKGVTYRVPLFSGTDDVFGKGDGYIPLTGNNVIVGNGYYFASGDKYDPSGLTINAGMYEYTPNKLSISGMELTPYYINFGGTNSFGTIYCAGKEMGFTVKDTYSGFTFNSNKSYATIIGSKFGAGNVYSYLDLGGNSDLYIEPFHYTKGGIRISESDYNARYYNGNKFLGLRKYVKDSSDITVYEIGPTVSSTTTDYTKYTNTAPLVQDTEDETKWYVPTEFLKGVQDVQIDGESIVDADTQIANIDYLKKGEQILIKADTDTVHAIVTSGQVDLGDSNTVGTSNQAAIGTENTLTADIKYSYALGYKNTNGSSNSSVIGTSNTVGTGDQNNVFGSGNTVKTGTAYSSVVGRNNTANQTQSYIFGEGNTNGSNSAVTIGFNNKNEYAANNYIFGYGNEAVSNINQFIIGYNNKPNGSSIYIGGKNTATGGPINSENTVIGFGNTIAGYSGGAVIGNYNNVTVNQGVIVTGSENDIYGGSQWKYVYGYANVSNSIYSGSISIFGEHNNVEGFYNVALGHYNNINKDGDVMDYCVAVGYSNNIYKSQNSAVFGLSNSVKNTGSSMEHVCMGYGNSMSGVSSDCTNVGVGNSTNGIGESQIYGTRNTVNSTIGDTACVENISVFGGNNTITIKKADDYYIHNTTIGFGNKITNPPVNSTIIGRNMTVTNATEMALGYINNSTSGSTVFSVGNGYYNSTNGGTYRHNLIEANQDGDLYIVEKTNTDGDTTNFYERPMKRLQTWLNEKVDIANIGADDDTTAYTHVCPIVQDTVDTSKWTIPSRYLDATIQDAAFKSEANTFSKTNTFTDGTGNDVIVAANSVTVQSETNATIITSSGITNGAKTSKDLFNATGDYAHIGTSADTADYTDVAPIKETSETYTPAGGTETTETNTIVPMDYMPKKLHVEDKVDEKSTQVVSSKAIYEAIPHIYVHDISIAHGTNTKFFIYMQIMTLGDYDFSTVANIASWLNTNGYNSAINGHVVNGSTNGSYNNALTWFSTNGTTLQLMYETNSNYSYYTCDAQIKVYTHKRKLFNE